MLKEDKNPPAQIFEDDSSFESITQLKSARQNKWIYLSLLVIMLFVLGIVLVVLVRLNSLNNSFNSQTFWYHSNPTPKNVFKNQNECESTTGMVCIDQQCDYKCPKDFQKGWVATENTVSSVEPLTGETDTYEAAEWLTYKNEEYGFEFKYPQDTKIIPSVSKNNDVNTFEKFYQASSNSFIKNNTDIIKIRNLVIDGYQAVEYYFVWPGHEQATPSYSIITLVNRQDEIIEISASTQYKDEFDSFKPIYGQILSTFRFIDPVDSNLTTYDSKEKCLQAGGVWQNWGLFPGEYCQIPSADGGKSCTDGSQCNLNSCITYSDSSAGQCRTYQDTFGCYSELVDGTMSPTLCFD